MATKFIQKGTELIKQAKGFEEIPDYPQALKCYSMGIRYLLTAVKYEKNGKVKKAIKSKIEKLLTRAEQIKNNLHPTNQKTIKHNSLHLKNASAVCTEINDNIQKIIFGFCHKTEQLFNMNIPKDIMREIILFYHIYSIKHFIETPKVKWDQIGGSQNIKLHLKEYLILPLKFPQLFTARRRPHYGLLLYGPSGVGKTHLIRAAVAEAINCNPSEIVFFNISVKELLQNAPTMYDTEIEKLIKRIYDYARSKKNAVILLKDIECLTSRRSDDTCTHDTFIRRCKTEILVQMHGVGVDNSSFHVYTIAMTRNPWDLDPSIRRRFSKRLYVRMLDQDERSEIFKIQISLIFGDNSHNINLSDKDYNIIAQQTDGFSGDDIRRLLENCLASKSKEKLQLKYFLEMIQNVKPSVDAKEVKRYIDWTKEFGNE